MLAVSIAVVATQALPLSAVQLFGAPLPLWFLTRREELVCCSSALSLFVMTSYYR